MWASFSVHPASVKGVKVSGYEGGPMERARREVICRSSQIAVGILIPTPALACASHPPGPDAKLTLATDIPPGIAPRHRRRIRTIVEKRTGRGEIRIEGAVVLLLFSR